MRAKSGFDGGHCRLVLAAGPVRQYLLQVLSDCTRCKPGRSGFDPSASASENATHTRIKIPEIQKTEKNNTKERESVLTDGDIVSEKVLDRRFDSKVQGHLLGGLELPEGDVDRDTTLALGLELVKHPRVLEGALAQLGSFL